MIALEQQLHLNEYTTLHKPTGPESRTRIRSQYCFFNIFDEKEKLNIWVKPVIELRFSNGDTCDTSEEWARER